MWVFFFMFYSPLQDPSHKKFSLCEPVFANIGSKTKKKEIFEVKKSGCDCRDWDWEMPTAFVNHWPLTSNHSKLQTLQICNLCKLSPLTKGLCTKLRKQVGSTTALVTKGCNHAVKSYLVKWEKGLKKGLYPKGMWASCLFCDLTGAFPPLVPTVLSNKAAAHNHCKLGSDQKRMDFNHNCQHHNLQMTQRWLRSHLLLSIFVCPLLLYFVWIEKQKKVCLSVGA